MPGKRGMMRLLHTHNGRYAISFILGIGLASLFRKICNDRNCIVFKAPPMDEVTKNTYAHGDKCYTFKEKMVKCNPNNKDKVSF
jgi:hypothetical protein